MKDELIGTEEKYNKYIDYLKGLDYTLDFEDEEDDGWDD